MRIHNVRNVDSISAEHNQVEGGKADPGGCSLREQKIGAHLSCGGGSSGRRIKAFANTYLELRRSLGRAMHID